MRGNASTSSQWAFLKVHKKMKEKPIRIEWAPGHTGIEGNEAADRIADKGAAMHPEKGILNKPTVSGLRSIYRQGREAARAHW